MEQGSEKTIIGRGWKWGEQPFVTDELMGGNWKYFTCVHQGKIRVGSEKRFDDLFIFLRLNGAGGIDQQTVRVE